MGGSGGAIVGVDIGATKTALLALDAADSGEVAADRFPTDREAGPLRTVEEIARRAEAALHRAGRSLRDLAAVGLAVPGTVDVRGRVLRAGKLAGWTDVPLRELLEDRLGVPAFVEQDANAAALGERWHGCAARMRSFAFLALGTGIGAGLFLEGALYRGAHDAAGELGDLVADSSRMGEGPPERRHLGGLIGSPAVRTRARAAVGEWLTAAESIRKADIDPRLEALAEEVADAVALAVIDVSTLLDPEAVVLGGGTAAAGGALLDRVRRRVEGELRIPPVLLLSSLGEAAQLHGALWGALGRLRGGGATLR